MTKEDKIKEVKRLIDANALSRAYMLKGKNKLRLSTVINELELQPEIAVFSEELLRAQTASRILDIVKAVRYSDDFNLYKSEFGIDGVLELIIRLIEQEYNLER